eukprot:GHVR01104573.1.p1 GENE.GHVR01104573.1~~GHVR01104573.1.p1  ORF type:complete len:179 (+),score=36.26 GHVR01104573.1:28-537(+)
MLLILIFLFTLINPIRMSVEFDCTSVEYNGFSNNKLNGIYQAKDKVTDRDHYINKKGIHMFFGESPDQWIIDTDMNPKHVYAWKRSTDEVPPEGLWYELYGHNYDNGTTIKGYRSVDVNMKCHTSVVSKYGSFNLVLITLIVALVLLVCSVGGLICACCYNAKKKKYFS